MTMHAAEIRQLTGIFSVMDTEPLLSTLRRVAKPSAITTPEENQIVHAIATALCERFPQVDHLLDLWWQGQWGEPMSQGQALVEAVRVIGEPTL